MLTSTLRKQLSSLLPESGSGIIPLLAIIKIGVDLAVLAGALRLWGG